MPDANVLVMQDFRVARAQQARDRMAAARVRRHRELQQLMHDAWPAMFFNIQAAWLHYWVASVREAQWTVQLMAASWQQVATAVQEDAPQGPPPRAPVLRLVPPDV